MKEIREIMKVYVSESIRDIVRYVNERGISRDSVVTILRVNDAYNLFYYATE